ncbi:MAG TPA: hypothetical protein VGB57_01550 [Allosphingosinicella sp.]
MKKRHVLFVIAAAAASSPAVAGGLEELVVREGLTVEQLEADGKICLKEAKNAERGRPVPSLPRTGNSAGDLAGAAAAGALKGLSDVKRFEYVHNACLSRLGYRLVQMTPEERKAFSRTKGKAAGLAYIVEFSRRAIAEGR